MTRDEIIANARKLIYETDSSNSHFTPEEMIAWYEDWHRDIAMYSKWPKAEATVTGGSIIGQSTYPIDASKVLEILKVYYNKKPIEMKTVEFLDEIDPEWRTVEDDDPEYVYMMDSDVIGFYPAPKTAGDEIRLRYVKIPNKSTVGMDVPDVSVGYHISGGLYIAAQALRSIGNSDEADKMDTLYMLKKKEVKGAIKSPEKQQGWDWGGAGNY